MIRFKGKGEHNITELEQIIWEQLELLRQKQLQLQDLQHALDIISNWKLPDTGKFWDAEQKNPMSYAAAYGSNGERDYMKDVAKIAIFKCNNR